MSDPPTLHSHPFIHLFMQSLNQFNKYPLSNFVPGSMPNTWATTVNKVCMVPDLIVKSQVSPLSQDLFYAQLTFTFIIIRLIYIFHIDIKFHEDNGFFHSFVSRSQNHNWQYNKQ